METAANNLPAMYSGHTGSNHPAGVVARAESSLIGRTPLINEEKVRIILEALKEGKTKRQACKLAGISKSTLYVWQQVNTDFMDAVERSRQDWTDSLVDEGLTQLQEVEANTKDDGVKVRKAECIARHTLEIASRLNPAYAAKQQTTNLNVNVEAPVDLDALRGLFNR